MRTLLHILLLAVSVASQPGGPIPIPPMLRFQCSQLVVDRIDPLVNPNQTPSPHLHQIVGGNSFNASMTHDLPSSSTCTSCTFSEDFSNYWTAVLYFRARNGTYKRVPQLVSEGLKGNAGVTVYYIPDANATNPVNVTAFKPGFRMLSGDATATSSPSSARKTCHRCMPKTGEPNNLNCASPDSQHLPKTACEGGIRSVVTFPTCWDGVNVNSPDHMGHVAYAVGAGDNDVGPTGRCPGSHPVVIPQVMYEVMWDTRLFNDPAVWPEDGSQPFVLSTGDRSGYSIHGDYVFGWKDDSLKRAMDTRCTGDVCSVLETQTTEKAMQCTVPRTVVEDVDGWLAELPGGMGAGM